MRSIQPIDKDILLKIYRWKFVTRQQIERLFFPNKQQTKNKILSLKRWGLIRESNVLPSNPIFLLSSRGEAEVKKYFESISQEPKFTKVAPDKRFIKHHIQTNDFHAALIANNESGIKCPLFIPYYLGEFNKRLTQCQNLDISRCADAFFILTKGEKSQFFILEIDRGTQSVSGKFLDMIAFYQEFLITKNFKTIFRRFDLPEFDFFWLLIVTSSLSRAQHMRKAGLRLPNREVLKLFLVTGVTIGPENIFGKIWQSMDVFNSQEYSLRGN